MDHKLESDYAAFAWETPCSEYVGRWQWDPSWRRDFRVHSRTNGGRSTSEVVFQADGDRLVPDATELQVGIERRDPVGLDRRVPIVIEPRASHLQPGLQAKPNSGGKTMTTMAAQAE